MSIASKECQFVHCHVLKCNVEQLAELSIDHDSATRIFAHFHDGSEYFFLVNRGPKTMASECSPVKLEITRRNT